ncbi:MAG: hypothetical protein JNM80_12870 [Phycisphaerae bacterium]|nr:hypothetical protein [Phycisphaerae bacterium]
MVGGLDDEPEAMDGGGAGLGEEEVGAGEGEAGDGVEAGGDVGLCGPIDDVGEGDAEAGVGGGEGGLGVEPEAEEVEVARGERREGHAWKVAWVAPDAR